MKKLLLITIGLVFCCGIQMQAQSEQTFKPWVLQLIDGNKANNYVLSSFSYSIDRSSIDSIPLEKRTLYVNINFVISTSSDSKANEVITQWMTDPSTAKDGKILFKDKKTGNILKEFSFGEAYVSNIAESYYDNEYSSDYSQSNLSLSITCKKFAIGNVQVKNLDLPLY